VRIIVLSMRPEVWVNYAYRVVYVRFIGADAAYDAIDAQTTRRRRAWPSRPGSPTPASDVGWARTEFSDNFVPYLRDRLELGLDHEDAIELYYNAWVTPWLSITPSLQNISPGLTKALDSSSHPKDFGIAHIAGVRLTSRFWVSRVWTTI
jgi:porin